LPEGVKYRHGYYSDGGLRRGFRGRGWRYTAYVEELPGAISEGDTLEEARENLRDAVELLLETNRALNGQPGPGTRVTREKIKVSVA